jgi:prephenate dehydrogenase
MSHPRVTVVGVLGKFGSVLARRFHDCGCAVSGIDIEGAGGEGRDQLFYRYYEADEDSSDIKSRPILEALRDTQVLLLATPLETISEVISAYGRRIPPEALLVDIASVKTPAVSSMLALKRDDIEMLSIHPLFRPDACFTGRNIGAVQIRSGPRTVEFLDIFREWGCRITTLSADEHDLAMSYIQSLSHALVITLGQAGQAGGVKPSHELMTPFSRSLFELLSRIGEADPALYAAIQVMNPHTLSTIDQYIAQVQKFRAMVAGQEYEELKKYIASSAGPATT